MSETGDALDVALGCAPPSAFARLTPNARIELADLVGSAVTTRSKALEDAITDSLRYVPALLRPAVRRTLGLS